MAESVPYSLIHVHSLNPPTAGVRTWSSIPHPSPHTPLLATATSDRSVNIWDTREWKLLSTIAGGHKRSVRCVGWKDYGDYARNKRQRREENTIEKKPVILATGSFDANCGLWVWNKDRISGVDALATGNGDQQSVPGAFETEEDVERDFTGAGDDEADEDEDWHFSTLLTGPDSEIKDLEFSPPHYGANLLATCSRDKSVWVWEEVEPEEWETVAVLSEHTGDVKCVTWLKGARTTKGELRRRLAGKSSGDGNDQDEEVILGSRELLATGSYDDTIRIHHDDEAEGDWLTIAVLTGHEGTVWDLKFESYANLSSYPSGTSAEEVQVDWAPRLLSCSDDMTIRLWTKNLTERERDERRERIAEVRQGLAATNGEAPIARQTGFASNRIPSVIRPPTSTEKWYEESRLPTAHVRSVYAVDWSERTGLIVSCGGDGVIAVYQEVPSSASTDVVMKGTSENGDHEGDIKKVPTEWKVVATINDAHDEYEVNHVCWAPRRDHRRQEGSEDADIIEDEEYVVSTGDDGQVRIWQLPEEVLKSIQ